MVVTRRTTPSDTTCKSKARDRDDGESLSGLSSNTSYAYKAYSDSTCSTLLASAPALLTKPGKPTKPVAASGAGSGKLTLTASVTGNGTLSKWQYVKKEGTGNFETTWTNVNVTSRSLSHVVSGLTDGTSYQFKVRAVNATGNGADSDASDATAPADETLSASSVEAATATLTIGGHSGSWYYKANAAPDASCSSSAVTGTTVDLTGLSSNTSYTYKAYSDSTCSTLLASAPALLTKPGKPTKPVAASGAGSGKLTLTASVTGNGTLSKWQYVKKEGTGNFETTWTNVNVTSRSLSHVVSGLTDGTSYQFKVRAVNATGNGADSDASDATAPADETLSASSVEAATATLTIGGHSGSWYYKANAAPDASCSSSAVTGTTVDLTGLSSNTSYTYKAYSDSTCSTLLASAPALLTKPGKPTKPVAASGAGSGKLTLTASVTGNGTLSKWQYVKKEGTGNFETTWTNVNVTSRSLSHVVSGLTDGTSYQFKVRAVNATGNGADSDASDATAPADETLSASSVEAATATLTIGGHSGSWYYKANAAPDASCSSSAVTGTTVDLTGLSSNTSYTYKAYSDSTCSTLLASAPALLTKPGKPTKPVAASGAGSGKLTLTASVTGNGTLSKWQYVKKEGTGNFETTWTNVNVTSRSLSHVVSGLTDGTSYQFKVRAVNATGNGADSDASDATAPADETLSASSVEAATATLTIGGHSGSWYYKANAAPDASCSSSAVTGTTVDLTGLSSNTSYTYKAYSDSTCSTLLASAPALLTKPGKPTKPVAASGAGSGKLTLTASVTGNGTLSKWQYVKKEGTGNFETTWTNVNVTSRSLSHVVSGLTDGTSYQFKVRAVNATGNGADSDASAAAQPAAATLTVSGETHNSATLTIGNHSGGWHYKADAAPDASCSSQAVTGTTVDLTGLSSNTSYAYKAYSDSTCSTLLASESLLTKPGKPSGLSVTSNLGSGKLKLSGASVTGNRTVTKWQYVKKAGTNDFETTWTDITPNSATLDHTVSSLTDGTSYQFKVRAVNATGNGLESDASTAKSPRAETLTASSLTHNSATLSLTGHTTAWWYKGSQNGAQCVSVAANTNTASLSLQPGTTYTYTAYSDSGCSTVLASETFTTASSPSNSGQTPSTASSGGGSGGSRSALADPIRLGGDDRYHTAALVAQEYLRDRRRESPSVRVNTVIVASGENFPDALAAAPLARRHDAPVLLTTRSVLHERTKAFLEANTSVIKVYLLGGVEAISAAVEAELKGMGYRPIRVDGGTRYETAVEVAKAAGAAGHWCATTKPTALLVSGENWRDALTVAPVAYRGQHPLLLTRGAALPEAVSDFLSDGNVEQVVIVGDTDAVSVEVAEAVAAAGVEVERVYGDDAAYTARDVAIAAARPANYRGTVAGCLGDQSGRVTQAGLVTDAKFPDALAAGPLLGQHGAPVLFVSPDNVPTGTRSYVVGVHFEPNSYTPPFIVVGGIAAVPKAHLDRLLRLADW